MQIRWRDLLTGIGFLVLGMLGFFVLIPVGVDLPAAVQIQALSPDFWPRKIAIAVMVVAVFLIAEAAFLRLPGGSDDEDAEADAAYKLDTLPGALRALVLMASLFLFYFALTTFGIVASSIVLMPAMMLFFGERHWVIIVVLSLASPIGLYLFFLHVAGIPMPLGIFENLL